MLKSKIHFNTIFCTFDTHEILLKKIFLYMKKIYFIILLFLSNLFFSQAITSLSVTQNGVNQIKVHSKIYMPYVGDYLTHTVNISQNTISLTICYSMTNFGGISYPENDFYIDIPNNGNYTLVTKLYTSADVVNCDYSSLEDTVSLNFTAPIDGTVSLGIQENENIAGKFSLHPIPAKDILNIRTHSIIKKVNIYDSSGKLFSNPKVENSQINTSNLKSGVYFIEILTDKGRLHKKFIIEK